MGFARRERLALCGLLEEVGPDAPTLCAGWTTADLAAHLVIRERRPDAALGLVVPPLARYTERVRTRVKAETPYARLIEMIRQGPPRLSLWGLPGLDEAGNTVEYFVHHEDVRRGDGHARPRTLDPAFEDVLWSRLRMARFVLRRAPVGVELARPDMDGVIVTAGTPRVRVTGPPGELLLWALGRQSAAQVEISGDDDAVRRLAAASWGL